MSHSRTRFTRTWLILALVAVAVAGVVAGVLLSKRSHPVRSQIDGQSVVAHHATAYRNPLAGLRWGSYNGGNDELYNTMRRTSGVTRTLVSKLAHEPRARWFGGWYPTSSITNTVRKYIAATTHGRSDVLVQLAVFKLSPWEMHACHALPTVAQQTDYRRWIDGFAAGIGRTHMALILQPDLPFWFCVPHHSRIPLNLVNYAARRFSQLPNTAVYIDAGASDWSPTYRAVTLLRGAGIRYAHGFALNATHYDGVGNNIYHGAAIVRALNRVGILHKHFVISTAANGQPFTHYMYYKRHSSGFTNANVCHSPTEHRCVALGIPPTADVTNPRWRMSDGARALARKFVDGFMWIGRPWLDNMAQPFDLARTLSLARNWRYARLTRS
jgi:cellulase/cellobiase CelA1